MAKKKTTKKKAATPGRHQYLVSCTEEESTAFERASELEGHKTVQQWLLRLARMRSRKVIEAEESGTLDSLL